MNKQIINIIIAVVVSGGASFYGGMHYAGSKTVSPQNFANMDPEERQALRGQFSGTGGGRSMRNGNGANGEIISKDATSITIKLRDGSGSKIVFLLASTPIMKQATSTIAELEVGTQVNAMGTANADGSITAQSVQIRPTMPADAQK